MLIAGVVKGSGGYFSFLVYKTNQIRQRIYIFALLNEQKKGTQEKVAGEWEGEEWGYLRLLVVARGHARLRLLLLRQGR